MKHILAVLCTILLSFSVNLFTLAQNDANLSKALSPYFTNYKNLNYNSTDRIKVDSVLVDSVGKKIHVYTNEGFCSQPFRPDNVKEIYEQTTSLLPETYAGYGVTIYALGTPIEQLIPIDLQENPVENRTLGNRDYKGPAWVTPISIPYSIPHGLAGRHLSIWASHGRYYRNEADRWLWQRPHLYCTTEDLFTQTIAIPYLYPMLENAGAVVFTPRERDWQRNEVIVDNDTPQANGFYDEMNGKHEWQDGGQGFANIRPYLTDSINPFMDGSCRVVEAQSSKRDVSTITWLPNIPQDGTYAVYVSYKTMSNSVSDAQYAIRHQGVTTRFHVNQRMGGGTWVYLGQFEFDQGLSSDNCIVLSNESGDDGVITADAIRIGGGMGNVMRSDSLQTNPQKSGLPRFLEGARYYAQWAGFPYSVYSAFESKDDYSDDIRVRSTSTNYLARGSEYLPGDSGLCVPIEMTLAMHSDAGYKRNMDAIGTLGIYMSTDHDGIEGSGISRLANRDLCDMLISQVNSDLKQTFGMWSRRQMHDSNYGEARDPQMPGIILEMLSHQNYYDMLRGHDPYFKFTLARAIYKGILRFIGSMHGTKLVTQPLPIQDISAQVDAGSKKVTLNWAPQVDLLDESAEPTSYVVYTRVGDQGYDNGTVVKNKTSFEMNMEDGVLYRFKVCALNDGGKSFPSDEVCACYGGETAPHILIVDGFQRVAGPQAVYSDTQCGFDMENDPGVSDFRTAGFCGYQQTFSTKGLGRETSNGTGYSGSELQGMILAGNTHDYASQHAIDFLARQACTISSCTTSTINAMPLQQYHMMDVVMGAQRVDGYSGRVYKTFTPEMQKALQTYTQNGGNILISGAYIGSDMQTPEEQSFTQNVLKYQYNSTLHLNDSTNMQGISLEFNIYQRPNEYHYWVRNVDILQAPEGAFNSMVYTDSNMPAATAYQGNDYHAMAFGFPIECIQNPEARRALLNAALHFLINRQQTN